MMYDANDPELMHKVQLDVTRRALVRFLAEGAMPYVRAELRFKQNDMRSVKLNIDDQLKHCEPKDKAKHEAALQNVQEVFTWLYANHDAADFTGLVNDLLRDARK